jgi:hypothetical protein
MTPLVRQLTLYTRPEILPRRRLEQKLVDASYDEVVLNCLRKGRLATVR